ncbi:MAG: hypothetical protein D6701_15010, partial [Gemmatimonadetes bacterium]
GLRTQALTLLDEAVRRAQVAEPTVSPALLADIHFERGLLLEEEWRAWRDLGHVSPSVLARASCPGAPPLEAGADQVDADLLLAMNFLCPDVLNRVLNDFLEPARAPRGADRRAVLEAYGAAVAAYPAHVGANVALLLDRADRGQWEDVLAGAQDFIRASRGHPYGLLLSGVALQRLGMVERAEDRFDLAMRALDEVERDALTDIRALLQPDAARRYVELPRREREAVHRLFWSALDPILSTPVNEREVEHRARASMALLRYGSVDSDAARVLLRYGWPNAVHAVGEGFGLRTVFWDYGAGPDVTFRRPARAEVMTLTQESQAHMAEIMSVLPHRYDPAASRQIRSLPGQLRRFRGSDGTVEIEVHTEVPEALVTAEHDSIQVGLFLLDPAGVRVSAIRRRIAGRTSHIDLWTPVGPEVAQAVVELYNPQAEFVVGLRSPVAFEGGTRTPPVSDLLLVEPVSPALEDVRRSADWVQPLASEIVEARDRVGVLFELYDVPAGGYRLEARVLDAAAARPVSVRPAGEEGYARAWTRDRSGGRVTEYLTVDLSGVGRGRHELEVVLTLPGRADPVVRRQTLDVR